MISRIKSWLLMAGAVLLVLVGAYAAGGRASRKSAAIDKQRRDVEGLRKAKEIKRDVEILDDDSLAAEFDRLHSTRRR